MKSPSPYAYNTITNATAAAAATATTTTRTRASPVCYTSRATDPFPTCRPLREFLDPSSFSIPHAFPYATSRIGKNLSHFRVNYTATALALLFFSLLWHPVSMIVFIVIFFAWYNLYFIDQPLTVLGRTCDDRVVLFGLGTATLVLLLLTHVGLNVVVALLVGACVVVVHAVFRNSEDLYVDEENGGEGGLLCVVGSQSRQEPFTPYYTLA